jgi:hypothetical protein
LSKKNEKIYIILINKNQENIAKKTDKIYKIEISQKLGKLSKS